MVRGRTIKTTALLGSLSGTNVAVLVVFAPACALHTLTLPQSHATQTQGVVPPVSLASLLSTTSPPSLAAANMNPQPLRSAQPQDADRCFAAESVLAWSVSVGLGVVIAWIAWNALCTLANAAPPGVAPLARRCTELRECDNSSFQILCTFERGLNS